MNPDRISARLKIIQNLLLLEEFEGLQKHVAELPTGDPLDGIRAAIEACDWPLAMRRIGEALMPAGSLVLAGGALEDVAWREIKRLQDALLRLDGEIAEVERVIARYDAVHAEKLGELVLKILVARERYYARQRHKGPYFEEEYSKATAAHSRYEEGQAEARRFKGLPSQVADEIRLLYRKTALLVHPDRNPGRQKEAAELFKRLQAAYDAQDLEALREVHSLAVSGFLSGVFARDRAALEESLLQLRKSLESKRATLKDLQQSDEYTIMQKSQKAIQAHFKELKQELAKELEEWEAMGDGTHE